MATKTGAVISKTISWINEVKKNKIIAAILLLVQGILFIVRPQSGPEKVARSIAVFALVGCAAYLTEFFAAKDKKSRSKVRVILAVVLAIAAIVVAAKPGLVSGIVIYAIAVLAIINGIVNTWQLFRLSREMDAKKAVGLVINVLSVGLGISLIFTGKNAAEVMTRFVGIILIVNALTDLWTYFLMRMKLKEAR